MTELYEKLETLRKNNGGNSRVLLDIDETLVCTLNKDEKKLLAEDKKEQLEKILKVYKMDDYYTVHERPNVQKFLDYLFKNFKVSIWTAASLSYVLAIIEKTFFENHPERELEYLFHWDHCKDCEKKLGYFKQISHLQNTYKLPEFGNNSILIDDRDDNAEQKEVGSGHHIIAFYITDEDGKFNEEALKDEEFSLY